MTRASTLRRLADLEALEIDADPAKLSEREFWNPANGAWNSNGDILCTFGLGGMRLAYDFAAAGEVAGFEHMLSLAAAENGHHFDGPRLAWALEASKRAAAITCGDPWWCASETLSDALKIRDWLRELL